MYNVSEEFRNQIKRHSRQVKAKIEINDNTYDEENIIELTYEDMSNPSNEFNIGSTVAAKVSVSLINVIDVLETAIFKPYLGIEINENIEYVPLGVFYADDVQRKKNVTSVTLFDGMIKLEQAYFSDLSYPATITEVMNEIATKAGVTFKGNLPNYQIKEKPEGYTYREVVGFIAALCGGFAKFDRDGYLTIKSYSDIAETIDGSNYIDYEKRKDRIFRIDKITAKVGEEILSKGTLSAGGSEISFENPFITESILTDIYNKLGGFYFLPTWVKMQGNPALECGDIITLTTVDNEIINIPIMSIKLSFTGGLIGEIESFGESENKNQFNSSGSLSKKVERVVQEQALINLALINKANIEDLEVANAEINNLKVNKADVSALDAVNVSIQNLQVTKANVSDLQATNAEVDNLKVNKADVDELNAAKANITALESDIASINHLLAGNLTAENIKAGAITAGSGIIADGAIGDAQISSLNANKINTGTIDTSKVTIAGPNGQMKLQGNKLQIFDLQTDGQLLERIMLGVDENNDASLVLRGADGKTVLLTQDGLTDAGFTDGYNKLEDGSLDPVKINITKVVESINEGTTQIDGSKIEIDNTSLDILFSSLQQTVTNQGELLTTHSSQISALNNEIKLKVSEQEYQSDKQTLLNRLSTAESSIQALSGEINLKVNRSDVYVKSEIDGLIDETKFYTDDIATTILESVAQLSMDVNSISSVVSQFTSDMENMQQYIESQVQQTASNLIIDFTNVVNDAKDSIINQYQNDLANLNDDIQSNINDLQSNIESLNDDLNAFKTTFRFSLDGFEIGKSDSPLKMFLTNEKLSFLDAGTEIAYISSQKMFITEAEILNSIKVGNHIMERYNDEITLIRWVG